MEKEESSTDGLGVSGHPQMKQKEPRFKPHILYKTLAPNR